MLVISLLTVPNVVSGVTAKPLDNSLEGQQAMPPTGQYCTAGILLDRVTNTLIADSPAAAPQQHPVTAPTTTPVVATNDAVTVTSSVLLATLLSVVACAACTVVY